MWKPVLAAAMCMASMAAEARTAEPVDLELVLLADATGSIDAAEIRFQRLGYAQALMHPDVLDAIAMGFLGRIAVTYVEWGSVASQDVVVSWTVVNDAASATGFAQDLMKPPRRAGGRNAIGSALTFAEKSIRDNVFEGTRKVIDFSADSANNWDGIPIDVARKSALDAGITINGLAVLCRRCNGRPVSYDLEQAFADDIVGGPESFVITADSPESFALAVRHKLIREIAGKEGGFVPAVSR